MYSANNSPSLCRSVDLAQFRSDVPEVPRRACYPLYPVARAWIRNEPSNLQQAPRDRSPTPDPGPDSDADTEPEQAVYRLPSPTPAPLAADGGSTSLRVPAAAPRDPSHLQQLDLELEGGEGAPAPVLLSNHLVRWWSVRKSWKQAAADNEKRYQKSLNILKDMYDNVK